MNEAKVLQIINSQLAKNPFIGDDTAHLKELGLVATTDTLVEDIHFRLKTTTPHDLGFKAMAVNLSDIASDGAIPIYALISLSLPKYINENFIKEFYQGVNELCIRHNVTIIGGDVTGSNKLFINITLIGKTLNYEPARRSNANVGDVVIATGFYGTSKAGFEILENEHRFKDLFPDFILEKFKRAHNKPEPHIGFGRIILQNTKNTPAMMDTSDGLADTLIKIAQSSKVTMEIEKDLIPYDSDLKEIAKVVNADYFDWILYGGEDYTLVACVDENAADKLAVKNIPIRKIGRVVAKNKTGLVKIKSQEEEIILTEESVNNKIFNHFKK